MVNKSIEVILQEARALSSLTLLRVYLISDVMQKNMNNKINKIISKNYSTSFMSNTKWEKLIDGLTDEIENGIYVKYKLIYGTEVYDNIFITSDFMPFFAEPTLYKEVEWIEIPKEYEDYVSRNNFKAGKTIYTQDLVLILSKINQIGLFEFEQSEDSLKVFGYK